MNFFFMVDSFENMSPTVPSDQNLELPPPPPQTNTLSDPLLKLSSLPAAHSCPPVFSYPPPTPNTHTHTHTSAPLLRRCPYSTHLKPRLFLIFFNPGVNSDTPHVSLIGSITFHRLIK